MTATVRELALAPVKGMQLVAVRELELRPQGVREDRAFLVVEPDGTLVKTASAPRLLEVAPRWDTAAGTLSLTFPDGAAVTEVPVHGAPAATANYAGRRIGGRFVDGELAAALSAHLGRPVRLLARDEHEQGPDDHPISVMSAASLAALAPALGGRVPDARRFRMNIAIDGVPAWEEHGWGGRALAVGDARLRGVEPVPRCVVTTRDPHSGRRDAPVLKALAELRGKRDVTFGLWCAVERGGRVRAGDELRVDA